MGKVDLGMKLTCESCGARFYDLNKQLAICPKCGTKNARPQVFRSRRPAEERAEKAKSLAAAAAAVPKLVEDPDVEANDDEAEDVIEDTSDLGEDDEDVEVVIEKDEPS
ncbi:MAG: TIGR02300 family protein [Alphaproteobacteria bacterium]|nr:TIGR02300 family protein [Alphaproteobacteria bacterium]PHX98746.1 MAG: TIGR02300 family protein [Rhodospirillaceae bacterium]